MQTSADVIISAGTRGGLRPSKLLPNQPGAPAGRLQAACDAVQRSLSMVHACAPEPLGKALLVELERAAEVRHVVRNRFTRCCLLRRIPERVQHLRARGTALARKRDVLRTRSRLAAATGATGARVRRLSTRHSSYPIELQLIWVAGRWSRALCLLKSPMQVPVQVRARPVEHLHRKAALGSQQPELRQRGHVRRRARGSALSATWRGLSTWQWNRS